MDKAQKVILTKEEFDNLKASLNISIENLKNTKEEYTNYKATTSQQIEQLTYDRKEVDANKADLQQRLDISYKTLSDKTRDYEEQIRILNAGASKRNKETTAKEHNFNEEIIKLKGEYETLTTQKETELQALTTQKDKDIQNITAQKEALTQELEKQKEENKKLTGINIELAREKMEIENKRGINRYAYVVLPVVALFLIAFFISGVLYFLHVLWIPITSSASSASNTITNFFKSLNVSV